MSKNEELEKAILDFLYQFDDEEFHFLDGRTLKYWLRHEFSGAIEKLRSSQNIDVEHSSSLGFHNEGETPQESNDWEVSIKLFDKSKYSKD